MKIFRPKMYAKDIYHINYDKLKNEGIKCLFFDLDNTIIPANVKLPDLKARNFLQDLEKKGFKVIIVSNSPKKRIVPIGNYLGMEVSWTSLKPLKRKYKKIMKKHGFEKSEIAAIGDQLLTDILGANRMNFTSILVDPVSGFDLKVTKFNRFFERIILKKLNQKYGFKKGEYYE